MSSAEHEARSVRMAFVGPGRTAVALALGSMRAGFLVAGAVARRPDSDRARTFARATRAPLYGMERAREVVAQAEVVWITVPDGAISHVCRALADAGAWRRGQVVFHTSGALASDALEPAALRGARTASVHPLQTFAGDENDADRLKGVAVAVEGHPEAVRLAFSLAEAWGARPFAIAAADKPAYHAAAVLASNALVALIATAARLAPLPDGAKSLLPLARRTLENLEALGIPAALTGPIERGDVETVARHLNALERDPAARRVYLALAAATVPIAVAKGTLEPEALNRLSQWFADTGGM
ncbi:Rossmann-like and DUF2520 domain-containing protein [Alicyclobacillus fructus]|uniref:Rossmann-like and DUF2520 domain-containing protein n=1 Tax=Alicyclobacillus fructus TaxID=2816082 RepID=UPI001A8EBE66|nr:Rossmann-like and DUF2520 domain-containing protein [Alicyclobacillus fructus]